MDSKVPSILGQVWPSHGTHGQGLSSVLGGTGAAVKGEESGRREVGQKCT